MIYYFVKTRKGCIYFSKSEFDSPDQPGSGENMQNSTLEMLCRARTMARTSFIINSGFRTTQHNLNVNGVANSAHKYGYAVDIATTAFTQQKIYNALKTAGFKRFGIYANYIHTDNDPTKPTPATWGDNPNNIQL